MKQKLTINQIAPNLNQVILATKRHWGLYSAMKRKWKLLIMQEVVTQNLKPMPEPIRVIVSYTYPDNRRRDPDNYLMKFIFDGLVEAGIISDDNYTIIKSIIFEPPTICKGISQTKIILETI